MARNTRALDQILILSCARAACSCGYGNVIGRVEGWAASTLHIVVVMPAHFPAQGFDLHSVSVPQSSNYCLRRWVSVVVCDGTTMIRTVVWETTRRESARTRGSPRMKERGRETESHSERLIVSPKDRETEASRESPAEESSPRGRPSGLRGSRRLIFKSYRYHGTRVPGSRRDDD